jgi:hypothetical protein
MRGISGSLPTPIPAARRRPAASSSPRMLRIRVLPTGVTTALLG